MQRDQELRGPFAAAAERLSNEQWQIAPLVTALLPRAQLRADRRTPTDRLAGLALSELAIELLSFVDAPPREVMGSMPLVVAESQRRIGQFFSEIGAQPPSQAAIAATVDDLASIIPAGGMNPTAITQVYSSMMAMILQQVADAAVTAVAASGG